VKEGSFQPCCDILCSPCCSKGGRLWQTGFRVSGFPSQKRILNLQTWRI